jgi:DNA-binding beta-propeller fold protein YncE
MNNSMHTTTATSNWRPLLRAFYAFLIVVAGLWAMPRNAHAANPSFITGLNGPAGLAVFGNTLFVANNRSGTVGEYNATTGAAINASFITGLNFPYGLAVFGDTLFVANNNGNTVGKYRGD